MTPTPQPDDTTEAPRRIAKRRRIRLERRRRHWASLQALAIERLRAIDAELDTDVEAST